MVCSRFSFSLDRRLWPDGLMPPPPLVLSFRLRMNLRSYRSRPISLSTPSRLFKASPPLRQYITTDRRTRTVRPSYHHQPPVQSQKCRGLPSLRPLQQRSAPSCHRCQRFPLVGSSNGTRYTGVLLVEDFCHCWRQQGPEQVWGELLKGEGRMGVVPTASGLRWSRRFD